MAAVLTDGREMQAPHLGLIDAAFEQVAAGIPTRLLLTMPPRHGKSRRAARWAPLWYLRRRTEHRVMIASYSSDLADDHGRWIRDAILNYQSRLGISLRPGSSAANRWYDHGVGVGELDGAFVIGSWCGREERGAGSSRCGGRRSRRPAEPLPWGHVMETTTLPAFGWPFSTYSMA